MTARDKKKASKKLVVFNVHGSVHRKNILIYIQQDATLHILFYLETALHVSGGTTFLMKLDRLLFCFLLLSWFVDIIWLIFIFSGLFVVNFSFSSVVVYLIYFLFG